MIYLVACAVNETVPDKSRVASMQLPLLRKAAGRHLLTAATAFALESAGIHDPAFTQAKAKAIRKIALMDAEMAAIFAKMEEAGIWYMPLKGIVLKDYYPQFGMREMADHDILFDASRADDVKEIMVQMGYEAKDFGKSNHDCYYKEPVCNFEMHRALFDLGHENKMDAYYWDVKDRLIGEGYEKRFTPEDFYVYMTAHEYKHYSHGGTGLRSLLDTYVYLRGTKLDMHYIETETEKLEIRDFERRNRSLSLHLYGGEALTASDREMLEYILSSGAYGTFGHAIQNRIRKSGRSKIGYMLSRFSVPISRKNLEYAAFADMYPFFYRHRILLPLLPFYRTFRAIKSGSFKAEAKAVKDA